MRIAVTCGATSQGFLAPVEKLLESGGHEVRRFTGDLHTITTNVVAWQADAIFHEWIDSIAFHLSRVLPTRIRRVFRMHRFEAETEWPSKMDWTRARLIVTSQHVLDRAEARCPLGLAKWATPVIVPSIVDFAKFECLAPPDGKELRLACVGSRDGRKQPGLALAVLVKLKQNWNVRLTFIGTPDLVWDRYLTGNVNDRLDVRGWTDDAASIWTQHDICLSASADEGCPYNVIEAMASGALPLVHRYEGATEQFPKDLVWFDLDELNELIEKARAKWTPETLRAWAFERYSIEANRDKVLSLFKEST